MDKMLIDCTINMLQLFIDFYYEGTIDYYTFNNFTRIKLEFLEDYLYAIPDFSKLQYAKRILSKCFEIHQENSRLIG